MTSLARGAIVLLAAAWVVAPAGAAGAAPSQSAADAKFKLKPGAHGKVCLGCHSDFEDKLKLPAVHTPVKNGDCTDCHSPHASDHRKMLTEAPGAICVACHADIVPKGAKSVHQALAEGNCVACHDPHASKFKNNLLQSGNELCLSCHKPIGEQLAKNTTKHPPVASGCVTCHDPHASTKSEFLLAKDEGALCTSCHKPDQQVFVKSHMGYPVAKGRCTSCHDPHGSSDAAMMWPSIHKPVAAKQCAQCHNEAGSPNALKTKKQGLDTCRGCHGEVVNQALGANRLHWPVADKVACLNCHGPHATREPKLVKGPMTKVCGSCHADTILRQAKSVTKHPPIEQGDCTSCHSPHGSNNAFLFVAATQIEMCGACHDYAQHTGHPIGAKAIDPRNKNLSLDCESCHRAHGTSSKHFTHGDAGGELCVQCHTNYRR